MTQTNSSDLTRTTLAVLFIGILIAACFWVMRPFLSSLLWAAMIVIATWPFFLKLQARLWGKRWLAVLVMTVLLLLVLIVPICFAVLTILEQTDQIVDWFVGQEGNCGLLVLHFLLSIGIAAVLYDHGETAAGGIRKFARRDASQTGDEVAVLSAKAIRGVALGIVVTALAQSSLGGVGLFFAGVPAAALLTAVMLMLCIAQVGPGLVLIPAAIWLFHSGHNLAGSIFSVWAILVCTIDNFLRPVLIRKGVELPLLLIIT